MSPVVFSPLYAIVDVVAPPAHREGERSSRKTEIDRALALADRILGAGGRWLQLRAKGLDGATHLAIAREFAARARRHGARLIVNDRTDVALLCGAAGVHVGQDDLACTDVRRLVGPDFVVGVSTHDVAQASAAERAGASYVGFGPLHATVTKADALPPRALAELAAVRAAVSLPIVAIGGIDESRAVAALRAGADAVAMIGALATSPDPAALVRRLLALAPGCPGA